ncbi:MAG: alpha-amylase family glycosyl hydrolase [Candidatus Zixiibacteriota bacterium]
MDLAEDKLLHSYFPFGVQVSHRTWTWLELDKLFDQNRKELKFSSTFSIRKLADLYNLKCVHGEPGLWPIRPGQLVTVSIIVDILRYVLDLYCREENPNIVSGAHGWIDSKTQSNLSLNAADGVLSFFPSKQVVFGEPKERFLNTSSEIGRHREAVTQEGILLSLSMDNPAFQRFRPLFDTTDLKRNSPFDPFISDIEKYFEDKPPFAYTGEPLFQTLRAPMRACPNSLEGQLDFIKTKWAPFLPKWLLKSLLMAADILREETQLRGWGPGPSVALEFGRYAYGMDDSTYPEPAAFSRDADWMSNVVIIAKSTYVWLDQLSKKYQRHIRILSDIPDEELDKLARWGFTGLWLIGIWERSRASQKIKQIMGNPEAAPSAYSLYDYIIAHDLGGEEAYQDLKARAWKRGIRLASDMVPNHMGIYSRWVVEHPDWFVQSEYPPFPVYQYTGVDLSEDDRTVIQIEDGYWTHRDAAVVFKRIDKHTGGTRYIYHGNDGTSTPWNDTAQLNFMNAEVREAVIQTILHVARKFPIIRFDAAMTLAKKHYQRLWFPKPGDGGAIPSRAEHGMTKAQFDAVFPKEFWREVVDRIASEVPDTLLLAEAFWLMEGYFVRTLGMHRVYNSAFMNMLKMEDNGKYRTTIKNVLEFSPEIAKRFVNFMNNPDEKTAVEQFGKGDKYIGIALMMVTMPGLPMFGHGQIEGYTEKYGMEYYRAYWDEQPDEELIRRHEREIFPLMRRRNVFSGSRNFAFYDFVAPEGWVNENVFAYSNMNGGDRALILYNNSYDSTLGAVRVSTAINIGDAEDKTFIHKTLAHALDLKTSPGHIYRFTDYRTRLQYLRSGEEFEKYGFYCQLSGYQYLALMDFKEIFDSDGSWTELKSRLNGNGVYDLDLALLELQLEGFLYPFHRMLETIFDVPLNPSSAEKIYDEFTRFHAEFKNFGIDSQQPDKDKFTKLISGTIDIIAEMQKLKPWRSEESDDILRLALVVQICNYLNSLAPEKEKKSLFILTLFDKWLLFNAIQDFLSGWYHDGRRAYLIARKVKAVILAGHMKPEFDWTIYFTYDEIKDCLQIHEYEGEKYFNKELFERLLTLLLASYSDSITNRSETTDATAVEAIKSTFARLLKTASSVDYKLASFCKAVSEKTKKCPE